MGNDWGAINTAVKSGGKYVILDISACSFPGNNITGSAWDLAPNDMNIINDNQYIKGIVLPDSLAGIGDMAFLFCGSLTSVTIPDSVASIGERAFFGYSSLTSITIPESVSGIGARAFVDCSSLTSIVIPGSAAGIGGYAFSGCGSLTSVTFGAGSSIKSADFGDNTFPEGSGGGGNILRTAYQQRQSASSGDGSGTCARTADGSDWTRQ